MTIPAEIRATIAVALTRWKEDEWMGGPIPSEVDAIDAALAWLAEQPQPTPVEAIRYVWRWAQMYAEKHTESDDRYSFMCGEIDKVVSWIEPKNEQPRP